MTLRIVSARKDVLSYFDAEYGSLAADARGTLGLEVQVGTLDGLPQYPDDRAVFHSWRHKITQWTVAFSGLEGETPALAFKAKGRMALPYLQAFYLEPMLRFRLIEAGCALVHGCSLLRAGRSVLFAGLSRVGKTTLTLKHAAEGRPVQGDNYVIVSPQGTTYPFPRRLRIHADVRKTSPRVYGSLPLRERLWLRFSSVFKVISAQKADLTSRLRIETALSGSALAPEAQLDTVFVLTPSSGSELAGPVPLDLASLLDRVRTHSAAEGAWLRRALETYLTEHPQSKLIRLEDREAEILEQAFHGVPAFEVFVPQVSDTGALADQLARISCLDG